MRDTEKSLAASLNFEPAACPSWAENWSTDEAAECLPYWGELVSDRPDSLIEEGKALYAALWRAMDGCPADAERGPALDSIWSTLKPQWQNMLIAAYELEYADY